MRTLKFFLVSLVIFCCCSAAVMGQADERNVDSDQNSVEIDSRDSRWSGRRGWRSPEQMKERNEEYVEWLEQNYPEEANELGKVKQDNPSFYIRRFRVSMNEFGRIFEVSRENPELAELMKKDRDLKQQRDSILEQYGKAMDEQRKNELKAELEDVVNQRFDIILERKRIAYNKLVERLERLKQELRQRQEELDQWEQVKGEKVRQRLNELISEREEFDWK